MRHAFYDRDLRQVRIGIFLCIAANLVLAAAHCWQHNWFVGVTCVVWAASLLLSSIRLTRLLQQQRDNARLLEALAKGVMRPGE